MYVRVYAPDGEPFDVPRERADRLILLQGWTQSAPIDVEPSREDVTSSEKKTRNNRARRGARARKSDGK
ncbi:hypothetical protein [Phaeobacter phage MD18]|nr:hypothetical protein [Phaeobacter phage MD18]